MMHQVRGGARRDGQWDGDRPEILFILRPERIGLEKDMDLLGAGFLPAKLLGAGRHIVGHRLLQIDQPGHERTEAAAGADMLFWRRLEFPSNAWNPAEFMYEPQTDDRHVIQHPIVGGQRQIECRFKPSAKTKRCPLGADAPDIADLGKAQDLLDLIIALEPMNPIPGLFFLDKSVGHFRQGLGRRDTDGYGDPGMLFDRFADRNTETLQIVIGHMVHIQEGLVDAIALELRDKTAQDGHHPVTEIAIELVVRGKDLDLPLLDQFADHMGGGTHLDAEGLGLFGARDRAPIVIAEDDDRPPLELRIEDPLAGGIEIIAINEREHH